MKIIFIYPNLIVVKLDLGCHHHIPSCSSAERVAVLLGLEQSVCRRYLPSPLSMIWGRNWPVFMAEGAVFPSPVPSLCQAAVLKVEVGVCVAAITLYCWQRQRIDGAFHSGCHVARWLRYALTSYFLLNFIFFSQARRITCIISQNNMLF